MQHLTYKEVLNACRAAYDNGTLLAKALDDGAPIERKYVYANGPYRCAIGAALNEETLEWLDNNPDYQSSGITGLTLENVITTDNLEELSFLQDTHDKWAGGASSSRFLKAIGRAAVDTDPKT